MLHSGVYALGRLNESAAAAFLPSPRVKPVGHEVFDHWFIGNISERDVILIRKIQIICNKVLYTVTYDPAIGQT